MKNSKEIEKQKVILLESSINEDIMWGLYDKKLKQLNLYKFYFVLHSS